MSRQNLGTRQRPQGVLGRGWSWGPHDPKAAVVPSIQAAAVLSASFLKTTRALLSGVSVLAQSRSPSIASRFLFVSETSPPFDSPRRRCALSSLPSPLVCVSRKSVSVRALPGRELRRLRKGTHTDSSEEECGRILRQGRYCS